MSKLSARGNLLVMSFITSPRKAQKQHPSSGDASESDNAVASVSCSWASRSSITKRK